MVCSNQIRAKLILASLLLAAFLGCREEYPPGTDTLSGAGENRPEVLWKPYDQSGELLRLSDHENPQLRFALIQSRISDKNAIFDPLYEEAMALDTERYEALGPLILGSNMLQLQEAVQSGRLSYEELTRFYLRRIYTYELDSSRTLHAIMALNPKVVDQARDRDYVLQTLPAEERHPIFGMPVLLKDNIGAEDMPTTAGAAVLRDHRPGNAFITGRLRINGALILGKVNLSEWAYFFCRPCPSGYSAVGGQTLNPYGRGTIGTGGSSSGSGAAIAAGYAVAAVGTETSGSILSPSGQHSVVGLKPTIGLLSRSGIVPISHTLDTPGPMARNVIDAGILMDAMKGYDVFDERSLRFTPTSIGSYIPDALPALHSMRLGVDQQYLEGDSLYRAAVKQLREAGATLVPVAFETDYDLEGFVRFLSAEMKRDLPAYFEAFPLEGIRTVADVAAFNRKDTVLRAPYGQKLFEGILADTTSEAGLDDLREKLHEAGKAYFQASLTELNLDAVLSIDNRHAGYAATAQYPALGVPMGYREDGEPTNLTFISTPFSEGKLLGLGRAFEALTSRRRPPRGYGFPQNP